MAEGSLERLPAFMDLEVDSRRDSETDMVNSNALHMQSVVEERLMSERRRHRLWAAHVPLVSSSYSDLVLQTSTMDELLRQVNTWLRVSLFHV